MPNFDRIDKEIVGEILEEIPEVSGLGRGDWIQAIIFPLAALAVIAAIPFLLTIAEIGKTNTPALQNLQFAGIENPILRSAAGEIADKRRALDEKDIRIRQYKGHIAELDNRLQIIQGLMRDTLRQKENQLLEEIESILGEERQRLQKLGRSDQQIDAALDRLKTNLDSDYTAKMDEYRNLELQVYETRLADLKREKAGLEEALAVAVDERRLLNEGLKDQESDLLTKMYQENEPRNIETAGIRADLEMLQESRDAENYWLDELANQYLGLLDALSADDTQKTQEHLRALESLFDDSRISSLPGIATRNEAYRELVRFFASYIDSVGKEDQQVILTETGRLIELAKNHTEEGRLQEAELTWRRLMTLWPLMGNALTAYAETSDSVLAADFRQYAEISQAALKLDDFSNASRGMRQGFEAVPGTLGDEQLRAWDLWNEAQDERLLNQEQAAIDALAMAMQESDASNNARRLAEEQQREKLIEAAEEKQAALSRRIIALETELRASEEEREALDRRITEQENVSAEPEDTNPALIRAREEIALRWRLYGIIVQIDDETLIIEPLVDQIPTPGSQMRVMRSLGADSVMQLADGAIIKADRTRATAEISTDSGGNGSFGKPERNDLIYIASP